MAKLVNLKRKSTMMLNNQLRNSQKGNECQYRLDKTQIESPNIIFHKIEILPKQQSSSLTFMIKNRNISYTNPLASQYSIYVFIIT